VPAPDGEGIDRVLGPFEIRPLQRRGPERPRTRFRTPYVKRFPGAVVPVERREQQGATVDEGLQLVDERIQQFPLQFRLGQPRGQVRGYQQDAVRRDGVSYIAR